MRLTAEACALRSEGTQTGPPACAGYSVSAPSRRHRRREGKCACHAAPIGLAFSVQRCRRLRRASLFTEASMSDLDKVISEAVANEDVPFLVGMVGNAGGVIWSGAAGERSPGQPATVDTVFRIFSMTKAVGSTAAMILIDRGKLSADTVVETILPEFAELKVLEGFDEKRPRLRAPRTKATVRHLATHTSGLVYEFWNTEVPRYMEATGAPSDPLGADRCAQVPASVRSGRALGLRRRHRLARPHRREGRWALDRSLLQGGDLRSAEDGRHALRGRGSHEGAARGGEDPRRGRRVR